MATSNSAMGDVRPRFVDSGDLGPDENKSPPTQIGSLLTSTSTASVAAPGPPSPQFPEHLTPHVTSGATASPGIPQPSPITVQDIPTASSRLAQNVSVFTAGRPPSPPPPSTDLGAVTGAPALLRSGSSGLASFNASRAMLQVQVGNTSERGTTLLAAAAAARSIAASPSFRRQQSGGGGGSFRRQPSGGAALSVTFSDPGSANSACSNAMTLHGEGSVPFGGRSQGGEHDRAGGSAHREDRNGGRQHGWLRGFFCFGGPSPDRPVGYHGHDDLAAVAKQRKEAQIVKKSTSRRLSKAMSDTFMVRSSRTPPIVAGATGAATSAPANACPGSPGAGRGTRKLQPMLSLQPQKSILKSSSLKRRALETDPILIKVASARLGAITHELTSTAASAADTAGADSDSEELNIATRAANPAMNVAEDGTSDSPAPSGSMALAASTCPNLASPSPGGKSACDSDDLQAARATGIVSAEATQAEVVTAGEAQSQLLSVFSPENFPSSGAVSPKVAAGRWEPSISVVTTKGSTAAPGAAGWFPESPGNRSGAVSPFVPDSGGRALMKSTSLKHTTNARLAGATVQTMLTSVEAAASGSPSLVPSGGSGRAVATSTSGVLSLGPAGGGDGAGGGRGGGGGSGDGAQPSLVQRMMARQLSRGIGSTLGGGSSPKDSTGPAGDFRGGNSPMGRSTPRNAVLPLPPLMLPPNSTGGDDGGSNAAESHPQSPTTRRMTSLQRSAAGDSACPMTSGSQLQSPSDQSSLSHQDSPRYRRLAGRSSKLAAGFGGSEPLEEDCVDNPLYGKPERMTAPTQQLKGMIGTLNSASALPTSPTGADSRRRRVTTGGLHPTTVQDTVDYMGGGNGSNGHIGDGGTQDSSKPAGPESSLLRHQIIKARKDRTDSSPSETPKPAQAIAASLVNDDSPTPRPVHATQGGRGALPGALGDSVPRMGSSVIKSQEGHKTRPLAATATAAGNGHNGDSSSSASLEGYITDIAASLRATVDPGSQIGDDMKDSEAGDRDGDEEDVAAWREDEGKGTRHTPGEWTELDRTQARQMIAAELSRMGTFGVDSKVQVDHREAAPSQPPEAAAPLPPSGPLPQQVLSTGHNRHDLSKTTTASAAPATMADVAAVATDAQKVPDASSAPSSHFRLTKFHSLGRGAAKAILQPSPAAGAYLTAAMLRASAEAALDNVRRVSCNGGGAGLIAAAASAAAANLIPDNSAPAEGAPLASPTTSKGPAHLFVATPRDSLESWVRDHSRRCTVERSCAAPLGPLDPLDELSEVTGFRTSAAPPPPPPPPPAAAAAGKPTPVATPLPWAASPQALHRGVRLVPEPDVLQVWLHRNNLSLVEHGAAQELRQQDQRHGGAGAAAPVMRQSLPGNVRLGVKM
ncbi:hypothetical protein VaNZ11_008269 [Volvox africanus]|uniref:Uncharacterized protein n=1 Tax=Volvox africanus TaxID=51714 RepID=A0ABQ5S6A8_9CHLO|nr:hypothetical protein VaNZ11_008269 [Volvox africanus]